MNNPREFCRLPKAHTTILLTYNFDAIFFDRVAMNDLRAGASGNILVVADPAQIIASVGRWEGQLKHLGRRYHLASAATMGRFHPKVILRLGAEEGSVWIGSGNLTHGGWGGNRELCAAWEMGLGHADKGTWVGSLLERIASWCPTGLSNDLILRAAGTQWVFDAANTSSVGTSGREILTSFGSSTISAQLSDRWAGRQFKEARIFTGSTDEGGDQLRWLHNQFGVERAQVILDQSRASFRPELLSKLPLEVDVRHLPGPPIHAKFFWLDGPDGPAAVMGSANCSASAWLRPPVLGGNIEAVVAYEKAERPEFARMLSFFDTQNLAPAKLKPARTDETDLPPSKPSPTISEIILDQTLGEVQIIFNNPLDIESVTLGTTKGNLTMRPIGPDNNIWVAQLAHSFDEGVTAFVKIETLHSDGRVSQLCHWVNHLIELRDAPGGEHIANRFNALTKQNTPKEQQRIIDDIRRMALALINKPDSFPDLPTRTPHQENKESADGTEEWKAINPEEFVVSISDLREADVALSGEHQSPAFSLSGALRALFGFATSLDVDEELDHTTDPEDDADRQNDNGPDRGRDKKVSLLGYIPAAPPKVPEPKYAAQFTRSIEGLISGMSSKQFAETCTAAQLIQAAAYPLVAATLGRRGGWIHDATAHNWVRQVTDLLFTRKYGGFALIVSVGARYKAAGRDRDFHKAVGDGTLWLALLSSLSGTAWEGKNSGFERAFALRTVFKSQDLIASSDAGRMAFLLDQLDEQQARAVLEDAPTAVRLLDELEDHLRSRWEYLMELQKDVRPCQRVGDLLWHPTAAWAEVLEEKAWGENFKAYLRSKANTINASAGFHLNVTSAAEGDAALKIQIERLSIEVESNATSHVKSLRQGSALG